jgi:hypothetical protein
VKPAPAVGDRWCAPDGSVWRIVGRDGAAFSLSGPGPCRSLRHVSREELVADWTYVPAEEA